MKGGSAIVVAVLRLDGGDVDALEKLAEIDFESDREARQSAEAGLGTSLLDPPEIGRRHSGESGQGRAVVTGSLAHLHETQPDRDCKGIVLFGRFLGHFTMVCGDDAAVMVGMARLHSPACGRDRARHEDAN